MLVTRAKKEKNTPPIHFSWGLSAFRQNSGLVVLLAGAMLNVLLSTSCGTAAQATSHVTEPTSQLMLAGALPPAAVNQPYNAVLTVVGGNSPYHFSVKTGVLPPGIALNPLSGGFSGKPSVSGTFAFQVIVTDSPRLDQGHRSFTLSVGGGTTGGGATVRISLSPTSLTLPSNQHKQFTASVSGTSNTAVTWSATAGSVDASGVFTAPVVTAQTSVTVTATSVADPTKSASIVITVNPISSQALQIGAVTLPQAQQGDTFTAVLSASGGTQPYSWSVSTGALPAGIVLNPNGDVTGIPTSTGTFNFTVTATDAASATANANFSISVVAGSNFDGPAELPRVTVSSALADTPAPGSLISVNNGGDLQAALTRASCGDTIALQAGAIFTGKFTLPAKNCDPGHWIIVRTSAPDSALPPEGQRLTPCYGGVASLVGRPAYVCSNPINVLAKVQTQTQGDGPILLANGANYYRLLGLEVTRPVGTPGPARLISQGRSTGTFVADHIVVDRCWMHGQAQDETHNAMSLDGLNNVAVVDSYLNDFHCIASTGACTDAHAISGGNSSTQDGPYKIQDNFLEASGEAILFGGGPATLSPSDIQIIGNHFWKPWQWMPGNPNFVGGTDGHPFVVKNHLELKNAVRVLVEANLMENSWGGFSQTGYGILLTPKNQATQQGKGPFVCPLCQVTDVTIRYVHVSHAGGGIQIATVQDLPGNGSAVGKPALAGERYSIHDVVLDDLNKKYVGGGTAFEIINAWAKNPVNTITINHVTAFPDPGSHIIITGNPNGNAPMYGLVFTNNLVMTGQYPVWNANKANNCAQSDIPITVITNCFTSAVFANNALIGSPSAFPPSVWPRNNLFPSSTEEVGFMTFDDANGGNYELQSSSLYKGKGTDGKDLGADIVGLNAALLNVE